MTLGQHISQHRKRLGLSQEALGECLGVSRQAVSKWETDAATPDMENLLALARIFQISVAELTETAEEPATESPRASDEAFPAPHHRFRSVFWPVVCGVLAVLLVGTLALTVWLNPPTVDPSENPVESPPPPEEIIPDSETTSPTPAPQTDFALLWYGADGKEEFLEQMRLIAEQKGFSMMMLMLTDVLKEGTQIIYLGSDEVITQASNVNPKENTVFLPHVMSRKKQVIPMLSALWG